MLNEPQLIQAASNDSNVMRINAGLPIEIEAAKGEGKLPTFSMEAYTGAPMLLGGFYNPVIVDLAGIQAGKSVAIFLDHDPSRIIGQGVAKVSDSGVSVTGSIMGEDADATKVTTLAKNGFKWQASIGASITRREFLDAGKKAVVNGREVSGPMIIARESSLYEVSFVALGADSATSAAVAANLSKGTAMGFDAWVQAKGFDPATLNEGQKSFFKAMYDAEQAAGAGGKGSAATPPVQAGVQAGAAAPGFSELDAAVNATRREQTRRQEITVVAARFLNEHPHRCDEIEARSRLAIEAKTEPNAFELEMLREFRNENPITAGRRSTSSDVGPKVLEAAICMSARLGDVEKIYDAQTLEAADKHYRNGLGLQQLLLICAQQNGYSGLSVRGDLEEVLRAAFPQRQSGQVRAEFSTISLPNILSNTANKFITEAFMAVESTWRPIAAIRPVSDFKQITNHSLTGDLQYEQVGPAGEIKHGSLGEEVYTNQAKTYGKMLAITRQDIINDDLGAFAQVPRRLGRGGALKINDVFWTAFMDNSTFFTSGRGNYDDGTDTALDAAGLKAAMTLWDAMTDPDGKPLGSSPRYLLVPPGQWAPAMALMNSTTVNTGGSSTLAQVPNNNPWAGMFTVLKSKYLANSSYTGYSALAWYLLCDPNDIPVIEVCFLNGRDMPTVETADADFNTLGVQMRAYHDFGVAKQEYRGGAKFKGEA